MNKAKLCYVLVFSILLLAGPLTGQPGAVMVPGDFDQDGDIDLADFADFQTCFLGPAIPQSDPACSDARLDADSDVDLDDFEVFLGCLSGADNPADPNCACPSGQTNCDGTCTNTASDYLNCGACGNFCAAGVCQNGSCACGEPGPCFGGQLWCDGFCREVGGDPSNCGCCGVQCGPGMNCAGGVCQDAEPCPGCRDSAVMIPSDFDDDGDVDVADFADFQTCVLGSVTPQTDPECTDASGLIRS